MKLSAKAHNEADVIGVKVGVSKKFNWINVLAIIAIIIVVNYEVWQGDNHNQFKQIII